MICLAYCLLPATAAAGAQWGASGIDVPLHPGSMQVRLLMPIQRQTTMCRVCLRWGMLLCCAVYCAYNRAKCRASLNDGWHPGSVQVGLLLCFDVMSCCGL